MGTLKQANRKQLTSQLASLMAMRKRKVDEGFSKGAGGLSTPKLQQPGMRLKKLPGRRY